MFGFMKKHSDKDREEKERKKREKRDRKDKEKPKKEVSKPLTSEELKRLDEAKLNLLQKSDEGDYISGSSESVGSSSRTTPREHTPDDAKSFTSTAKLDIGRTVRVPPGTQPKSKPKGILKDKSSYGPEIPNQGVRGNLDDTLTLEENTIANELLTESQQQELLLQQQQEHRQRSVKSLVGNFDVTATNGNANPLPPRTGPPKKPVKLSKPKALHPKTNITNNSASYVPSIVEPPLEFQSPDDNELDEEIPVGPPSPAEKIYENINLQLPNIAPPRSLKPRTLQLKRLPAGDFGFSLRKGTVLERGLSDNVERKRYVIFAEPGAKHLSSGLLPGDRLLEVNGANVENISREELIEIIRASGSEVTLKVQPIPELSELSMRSGVEGQDVHIAEQSVKTGTLQRSGSMRYKSKQGRTDEQLASDKAWLQAEKVWLIHKGGFAAGKLLRPQDGAALGASGDGEVGNETKCKVKLDLGGEVLEVDEEDVEKANPPQFDRIEDLANLRYLNESSVLHSLRQRYGSNLIHTYAGQALLVLNPMHPLSIYSEKVINMFRGCKPEDMPPHIYATAQITYRDMLNSKLDQSIVLLGRSGSGKSTNVRHLLHYFAVTAGSVNNIFGVEKLNAVFTLLDAFGNSRTIMNTSATRYTSMTSLEFDHSGQIASASVQVMMLEKTRITRRPEGEPTFHVFYQMLAGIDTMLRKELQLDSLNEPNVFMTPLQRAEDRQRATSAWAKIHHSMGILSIKEDESKALYCVLAAIYHLGVAGTTKGANNKYHFAKPGAAQKAASLLGVSPEELSRAIFSPSVQVRSPSRGEKGNADTLSGVEALEGFVIGLYTEVFTVLVALINRALTSNYRSNTSILILDTPGLQSPASCGKQTGAGFEDLCHNYVEERLQLLLHDCLFTSKQDLYSQEAIECDFEMVSSSPQPMVMLIDKPSQHSMVRSGASPKRDEEYKGLLWVLDEEAIYPGSTDTTFTDRFMALNKEKSKSVLLRKGSNRTSFTLKHFQGTNAVTYNTQGWLKACRENPVAKNVTGFLLDTQKQEISGLFSTFRAAGVSTTFSGSIVGMEGTGSLRRTSSMRRNFTSTAAGLKRKSVCLQVKFQADTIVDTLRKTQVHFVHCLLPQHNAGLSDLRTSQLAPNKTVNSEDVMLNVPLVRSQIRGAEIVESISIHRQGYPEHMIYSEFSRRYEMLAPLETRQLIVGISDEKQALEKVLQSLEIEKASYRMGLSQVFFRAGCLSQLEDAREEKITGTLVKLQAYCRGKLGRKKLEKLKLQHTAVFCIQRNVQKFMAIREWPWWKLYTKVRPLLNVHRTEEMLNEREFELEQLKMKFDKLEKERNDYKIATEKLETKLSEVTADLSEEHMTSNQATEILETEQADRRRLEKELKDVMTKFNNLQRKHEMTEIDLYQARMMAAQLDELDEDEVDGDSIYKHRYEKLRRETELSNQKKSREMEEELEKYGHLKKQLERKLGEAIQDADDNKRQSVNWKKKSQRMTQEFADNKRHLEEQLSRNTDLEKRQRRFDNELMKLTEQLKDEKAAKERLQRERDQVIADKYAIEQKYKETKTDYEIQSQKVERLDKEITDLSLGPKDDNELMSMRRLKNEYERKLQDQEEELDDQAGTIQQLEQAKLRLEMSQENLKKQHMKEQDEKEQELEDMRSNTHKKLKTMENQVEEEYEDKQRLVREKRELERKIQELSEMEPSRDRDVEKRLRRDLKRTKALLQDAQLMLEKQKEAVGSRTTVKQLRNQLEDSEYACSAAVKARKGAELELQDVQQQLEEVTKLKSDADNRCMQLNRDKTDLLSKLEEIDEDMADVMKKYKATVQQQSTDQILIQDQSKQIEDLSSECQTLKERIAELESRVQFNQDATVDKQVESRLESKVRDVESRLQLEETSRTRAENQVGRLKEQLESVTDERDKYSSDYLRQQESQRRYERQTRDAKEELLESIRRETESSQKKHELEKKLESIESEYEQSQSDLRLAFKRIADLQATIEDQMVSDSEADSDEHLAMSDISDDSEDDDDFVNLVNHRSSRISPRQLTEQPHSESEC